MRHADETAAQFIRFGPVCVTSSVGFPFSSALDSRWLPTSVSAAKLVAFPLLSLLSHTEHTHTYTHTHRALGEKAGIKETLIPFAPIAGP